LATNVKALSILFRDMTGAPLSTSLVDLINAPMASQSRPKGTKTANQHKGILKWLIEMDGP